MVERPVSSKKRISSAKIADDLEKRIRVGEIQQGALLPTERDLQDQFDASRTTVRRALAILVERGLATNIPNRGTAVLGADARRTSANIAFIDGPTYVLRNMFVRLSGHLRELGFHLIHMDGAAQGLENCLEYAADNGFSAAIVWPFEGFPDKARVARVQKCLPIISLDHVLRGIPTDLAAFDNFEAARKAVSHLAAQGRRRIAVTGRLDMLECTHERFAGYMKALFDAGISPLPNDFVFCATSGVSDADVDQVRVRFSQAQPPDGVFILQDEHVPKVVGAIMECGLKIPRDVGVVTIGDDLSLTVDGKSLTAIAVDWEQLIVNTVNLLRRRLAAPHAPFIREDAEATLKVRGLCGAPKSEWDLDIDEAGNPYQDIEKMNPKVHIRLISIGGQEQSASDRNLIAETLI